MGNIFEKLMAIDFLNELAREGKEVVVRQDGRAGTGRGYFTVVGPLSKVDGGHGQGWRVQVETTVHALFSTSDITVVQTNAVRVGDAVLPLICVGYVRDVEVGTDERD